MLRRFASGSEPGPRPAYTRGVRPSGWQVGESKVPPGRSGRSRHVPGFDECSGGSPQASSLTPIRQSVQPAKLASAAGASPADLSLPSGSVRAAGESPVRLVSLFGEGEAAGASPADLLLPPGGSRAAGESPAEENPRFREKPFCRLRAWAKAHPGETLANFSQDLFVQSRSPSAERRSNSSESTLQSGFVHDLGSDSAGDAVLARTSQHSAEDGIESCTDALCTNVLCTPGSCKGAPFTNASWAHASCTNGFQNSRVRAAPSQNA